MTLDGGDFPAIFYLRPTQVVTGMSSVDFSKSFNKKNYLNNTLILTTEENIKRIGFLINNKSYITIIENKGSKSGAIALLQKEKN